MRGMLPDEVLRQPKAGFAAPVDYWLAHDLRPLVDDLLSESQVKRRGLFRPEAVRDYVDEHRRGAEDWSMQIWQLLTLEIWMQLFLDGGARAFASKSAFPTSQRNRAWPNGGAATNYRMKQLLQDARSGELSDRRRSSSTVAARVRAGANRRFARVRRHGARLR